MSDGKWIDMDDSCHLRWDFLSPLVELDTKYTI